MPEGRAATDTASTDSPPVTTSAKPSKIELGLKSISQDRDLIPMAQLIDLEGLPDQVAKAIAETVLNLKNRYSNPPGERDGAEPLKDLPSRPGMVIGSTRRVEIYDEG